MSSPTITMMVPTDPEVLRAAQVIQSMASEAGFTINIQATEFASSLQLASNGEFETYLNLSPTGSNAAIECGCLETR